MNLNLHKLFYIYLTHQNPKPPPAPYLTSSVIPVTRQNILDDSESHLPSPVSEGSAREIRRHVMHKYGDDLKAENEHFSLHGFTCCR